MEKSNVYFTSFKATGNENLLQKLHRLMKTAGFETIDFNEKYAAIKIISVNMETLHSFVQTMRKLLLIM